MPIKCPQHDPLKHFSKHFKEDCKPGNRKCQKTKMVDLNIPVRLSSHILPYCDDCSGYPHSFLCKTCDGSWRRYFAVWEWALNELTFVHKVIRNGRRRCHSMPVFTKHCSCLEYFFLSIAAPLLQGVKVTSCEEVTSSENDKVIDVCGAHFSICTVEETFRSKISPYSHRSMRWFMSQRLMHMKDLE